uniref:RRM domain-containing protein n=1 Tax=Alexandrium monilatum TaxID=311494 RepID=A0A7S4S2J3_9DINO
MAQAAALGGNTKLLSVPTSRRLTPKPWQEAGMTTTAPLCLTCKTTCETLFQVVSAFSTDDIVGAILLMARGRPELKAKLLTPLLADDYSSSVTRFLAGVDDSDSEKDVPRSPPGLSESVMPTLETLNFVEYHGVAHADVFRSPPGLSECAMSTMETLNFVESDDVANSDTQSSTATGTRSNSLADPSDECDGTPSGISSCSTSAAEHLRKQHEQQQQLQKQRSLLSVPQWELHQQQQQQRQQEQQSQLADKKKMTLVLAKFPRMATEAHIGAAFDRVLCFPGSVTKGRIVRDEATGDSACYGFFEFATAEIAEAAFEACKRSQVIIDDASGHAWHLRASHARRATVGGAPGAKRHRGRRAGQGCDAAPTPAASTRPKAVQQHPVGSRAALAC